MAERQKKKKSWGLAYLACLKTQATEKQMEMDPQMEVDPWVTTSASSSPDENPSLKMQISNF